MAIWNADGELVYDSGDALEQFIAKHLPERFNIDEDGRGKVDDRSPDKGPEPEGVVVGRVGESTYAFVGLERTSAVAVFDVTRPASASSSTSCRSRSTTRCDRRAAHRAGGPGVCARRPQPIRRAALGRGLRSDRHDDSISRRFCFGRVSRGRMATAMPHATNHARRRRHRQQPDQAGPVRPSAASPRLPAPTESLELPLASEAGDFDAEQLAAWCEAELPGDADWLISSVHRGATERLIAAAAALGRRSGPQVDAAADCLCRRAAGGRSRRSGARGDGSADGRGGGRSACDRRIGPRSWWTWARRSRSTW